MDTQTILERLIALGPGDPLPLPDGLGQHDLDLLLSAAGRHGLLGLLGEHIPESRDSMSESLHVAVTRWLAAARIRTEMARKALAESLGALARAGIRTVPLKGPCLGERIYSNPSSRPSGDVDLLVASADLDASIAAMEATGYHLDRGPLERWQRRRHRHVSVHRPRSPPVELHFRAYTGFGIVLASEPLLERARSEQIEWLGPTLVLAPEDELMQLCLHAAGHLFQRLGWLYDLALFVEKYRSELDWHEVEKRARALPAVEAIGLTLQHLRAFNVAVPDWHLPSPRKARGAEAVRCAIASPGTHRRTVTLGTLVFHLLLSDRLFLGLRSLFYILCWSARLHVHRWTNRRAQPARIART